MATDTDGVRTQAREQVQQATDTVRTQASHRLHEEVDRRSTRLGEQLDSFVQALRRAGEHLEVEGNEQGAKAAHQAADHAGRLAGYLRDSDSNRVLDDTERFARQRPWLAGGLGALVGFAASRFLKASSEGRYESSRRASADADAPITREAPSAELSGTPAPPVYADGTETRIG